MTKKITAILFTLLLISPAAAEEAPSKITINRHGAQQLIVNGEAFIMLAGEIHNSSASTVEYMNQLWAPLKTLNINTILAPVAWEQFEPKEGIFDYTLVENMIIEARKNGLRLGILWFASWKNGESSYAPAWVKHDTKRFFRVRDKDNKEIETISPFCEAAMKADAKAFAALMEYIKKVDGSTGTVIAMQVENEAGIFQDIDYTKASLSAFEQQVPQTLIRYMKDNRPLLKRELVAAWEEHGAKNAGTWKEVFGDTPWAKSFFTSWQYASYVDYIAKAGKEKYALPMFANCWLVQKPEDLPGVYPNGGPVSHAMDIWKAAASHIDMLAPDIYLPDFKNIVEAFHRKDNPLMIPEAKMEAGWAFYAFGQHHALCFSPFGIEDGVGNFVFSESYKVLDELMPLITAYQGSSRMAGFMLDKEEKEKTITMGNYVLKITSENGQNPEAYGLVIQTKDNEFIFAGMNFRVTISSNTNKTGYIEQVWEGRFTNEQWVPTRLLNGDETFHNAALRAMGRQTFTKENTSDYNANPTAEIFVYSPMTYKPVWTPGIYKVTTYLR
jgi:hypothetical protein